MDETLTRAFTNAYVGYEISFARFRITASDLAKSELRYRELTDAHIAFLQAAQRLARNLLEEADRREDAEAEPHRDEPQVLQVAEKPNRLGFFGLRRSS